MATRTAPQYFIGLDLGQRRDYTAIAVIERFTLTTDRRDPVTFAFIQNETVAVTHLERFPLGTPYPAICDRVDTLTRDLSFRQHPNSRPVLALDATGVGLPVFDLLETRSLPARLEGITITTGHKAAYDGKLHLIPRRVLLTRLHTQTIQRRFVISQRLRQARTLIHELSNLRVHFEHDRERHAPDATIGPARTTQHDDLVFATALALWFAVEAVPCEAKDGPLPGIHC